MLSVSCPSCGAPVAFRSHASVMAVCEYCRATVHKDAGAVRQLGKLSEVLEDYSPIQIGTAGKVGARSFTVIGRIQLRYAAGMWNEWYLMYEDGGSGWLGDFSGQFTVTAQRPLPDKFPPFEMARVGAQFDLGFGLAVVSDRREAQCVGGQGELPFDVGDGWSARVVDLRRGPSFATLDYSDGDKPLLYTGVAVTLESMGCQLLRDDEAIKASAGRYRGKVGALQCPSCGTAIAYLPGMADKLVCQACATRIDASTPQAEVLAAGERNDKVPLTLPLGAQAKIGNQDYHLIGAMKRTDDEGETWTEYLLYATRGTFFWLVEAGDQWWRSEVMDEWPEPGTPAVPHVSLHNIRYERTLDYEARVTWAAGAFNWKVAAGDRARVREFERGMASLAAENTQDELSWSRSTPVAADQVRAWFKLPAPPAAKGAGLSASLGELQWRFLLWILGLNAVPLIVNFGETMIWLLAALFALFIPPNIVKKD
ncbi:hypothetical protein B0920_11595 [Massilia sp. KIM]|uniref:DUF4178 domain-containing protein n=1 Tax=Massilia sp. KIM TaxID=1955422 RepID=UPI0009C483FC|nr:DUF4178 domain-containing protein [Massilia sp. KIM]OON63953.1 hypothetical protein B0920_11595 [Massilia sp. KIM]